MRTAWDRIKAWCHRYAPEVLENLNPGATEEELLAAERHLSVTFPDGFRDLYKQFNGQNGGNSPFPVEDWLSLDDMVSSWDTWESVHKEEKFGRGEAEHSEEINDSWWHRLWIPFARYSGTGEYCLDFAPSHKGNVGQIISVWSRENLRCFDAPSFTAWLGKIADDMESGELIYSVDEYEAIVPWGDIDESEQWRGVDM